MTTLNELIERLEEARDEAGGEALVLVATQPSWPLQFDLQQVTVMGTHRSPTVAGVLAGDTDMDTYEQVVYVVASGDHPHGRCPYAPADIYDGGGFE